MKLRNAGRAVVTVAAAVFAISVMGGAFGTQVETNFNDCMENSAQDDAARLRCCKASGGSWVELYDEDGYVIDAFCDGAEEVYEPQEVRPSRTVNPAVIDKSVAAQPISVASDPEPAAASVSAEPADTSSLERTASDPTPTPSDEPAPKKIKRKHHHRRHR